ncbi:single-stranded DNA-binding protein [Campylobacter gastrosuis]|uniref:Single-stranded DNA-binding protein n=1 Tax=Campylobacter gastrosuis TaxID=2974576 RepID=A0ABT7HSU1_9BACT|nr:single-stranded DNA-binding protein [Campylobacter gastrosuis]MDL0089992.1 single-stranded DNA-binding protein [Campylobacter gastrosuis]
MFNKVILVGNLTKDVQQGTSPQGIAYAKSALAVSRKYKTQNGQIADEVCFIDLVFFGNTAKIAGQYLQKGSKILVEGRLKFDTWCDDYGNTRQKHSVQVESLEMLGSKQESEATNALKAPPLNQANAFNPPPQNNAFKAPPQTFTPPPNEQIYDENGDEIPF